VFAELLLQPAGDLDLALPTAAQVESALYCPGRSSTCRSPPSGRAWSTSSVFSISDDTNTDHLAVDLAVR